MSTIFINNFNYTRFKESLKKNSTSEKKYKNKKVKNIVHKN